MKGGVVSVKLSHCSYILNLGHFISLLALFFFSIVIGKIHLLAVLDKFISYFPNQIPRVSPLFPLSCSRGQEEETL